MTKQESNNEEQHMTTDDLDFQNFKYGTSESCESDVIAYHI